MVVGILLLLYLAFGVYLYLAGPSNGFARFVTGIFPYPATIVDVPGYWWRFLLGALACLLFVLSLLWLVALLLSGYRERKRLTVATGLLVVGLLGLIFVPSPSNAVISYHTFLSRYHSLQVFQEKRNASSQGQLQQTQESPLQLKADALKQLTLNAIIREEAAKKGVSVSRKDVNEAYKQYADRSQGEANLRKQLRDYLGWSAGQFKQELKVKLLQDKLNEKLATDEDLNKDRKKKADDLLSQIKGGTKFETAAKQSDDATAQSGGDQGFVKRGELEPALEGPAFSLKVGEVSEVIKTRNGYVIIKVTEKQRDKVRLREILVKSQSLAEFIPDELKKTKVNVYVKDLVWNKTLYTIEPEKKDTPTATPSNGPLKLTPAAKASPK